MLSDIVLVDAEDTDAEAACGVLALTFRQQSKEIMMMKNTCASAR